MTRKDEMAALKTASIAQLAERFVREAALTDPKVATTFGERERHVKNVEAYVDEIGRRDELATLLPFLDSSDTWIAYCTADQLIQFEGTEDCALVTLDRLASADAGGVAPALQTVLEIWFVLVTQRALSNRRRRLNGHFCVSLPAGIQPRSFRLRHA